MNDPHPASFVGPKFSMVKLVLGTDSIMLWSCSSSFYSNKPKWTTESKVKAVSKACQNKNITASQIFCPV